MGVPKHARPWTSVRSMTGLSKTSRAWECIDLAFLQYLGPEKALDQSISLEEISSSVKELFVDVSQNPSRRSFTNASSDVTKCLTTSSLLYSYCREGAVLPLEHLLMQGHRTDVSIPETMTQSALSALAGEGFCLPCAGLVIFSLLATGCFVR